MKTRSHLAGLILQDLQVIRDSFRTVGEAVDRLIKLVEAVDDAELNSSQPTVLDEHGLSMEDLPPMIMDRVLQGDLALTLRAGADIVLQGEELAAGMLESMLPSDDASRFEKEVHHAISVLHTAAQFGASDSPRVSAARTLLLAAIERGEL